ncbi:MAG: Gfo/Idh/MocA family oxidoreductase [Armatimonadetes bacterium]|nr:Gfo/Idh/MocA family oxidoreductase [Armatimonadota bacterium]
MSRINVGVIGYGLRSSSLIAVLGQFKEVRLAAIADTSPSALKRATADHPGVETFADHSAMLDSGRVEAVLIESPPPTHASCAIDAMQRGIHVLSDVPAVHTIEEARMLWDAGWKTHAVYMLGATTNFWAYVDACLDMKKKGLLGDPFYLEAEYVADLGNLPELTPWRKHYEPIRYCTHSLGPVLKWIDEDLAEVSCFSTGGRVRKDPKDNDAMVAIFRTRSGIVVKLLTCFVNRHPVPYHRYVCQGTKGYFEKTQPLAGGECQVLLSTDQVYGMRGLTELPVTEKHPEHAHEVGLGGHGGADGLMIADFLAAVAGDKQPEVNMREAIRMSLPGLYALESARAGGQLTKISYPWE